MYNSKKNIIFFDIPKCGTTTTDEVLNKYGFKKLKRYSVYQKLEDKWPVLNEECLTIGNYIKFQKKIPEIVSNTFNFTIIRNPYERILSSWRYLKPNMSFSDFIERKYYSDKRENFSIFEGLKSDDIYDIYRDMKHAKHKEMWDVNKCVYHTEPQINSIKNIKNRLNIHYIGLLENIKDDLEFVLKYNNVSDQITVSHRNKSAQKRKTDLTSEEKALVDKYFKYDIKLYNLVKSLSNEERINYNYNIIFDD